MRKKRSPDGRGYAARKIETRDLRERFLIVCEGERTEPNYFRAFRAPKRVIDVYGVGANTISVVRRAIDLKSEEDYDQVWCVFDRDAFPAQDFNAAIVLAGKHNIQVAYSNEAFELWYLLHFHFYNTAITRRDYCARLHELLGRRYEKNSDSIYEALLDRQQDAIRNARRLRALYDPARPVEDNPSTTVHLLVEQLTRFCR